METEKATRGLGATGKTFKCTHSECSFRAPVYGQLTAHYEAMHEGKKALKCPYDGCNLTVEYASQLNMHVNIHLGQAPLRCSVAGCSYSTVWEVALATHARTHMDGASFKCEAPGCAFATVYRPNLNRHQRTVHQGIFRYQCDLPTCLRKFYDRAGLRGHFKAHTDGKPFACTFSGCGSKFGTAAHLRRHVTSLHTGAKRFRCHYAGCKYSNNEGSAFEIHIRSHLGEKPYKCPEEGCPYASTNAANLRRHRIRWHTGETRNQCPYERCNYTGFGHANHMELMHNGGSKYRCDEPGCGQGFSRPAKLRNHMVRHNGQIFSCNAPACRQSFPSAYRLRSHIWKRHLPFPVCMLRRTTTNFPTTESQRQSGILIYFPQLKSYGKVLLPKELLPDNGIAWSTISSEQCSDT